MRRNDRIWSLAFTSSSTTSWLIQPASAQAAPGEPNFTAADGAADGKNSRDVAARAAACRLDRQTGSIAVPFQKRLERHRDVPMLIAATTGVARRDSRRITSPDMVVNWMPSLTSNETVYGTPVVFARGLGFNDTMLESTPR